MQLFTNDEEQACARQPARRQTTWSKKLERLDRRASVPKGTSKPAKTARGCPTPRTHDDAWRAH